MLTTKPNQNGIIAGATASVPTEAKKPANLKDWVGSYESQFAKALPKVITPERFTRIALSALSNTPQLMECTPKSFLGALMQAAQLGLEPNTPLGQAYLIPYKKNKDGITECQFQIGYKGMIDLCYRSGEIASVDAQIVYQNDLFEYELGIEQKLKHVPAMSNRGNPIYVYGIFKLKNGGFGFAVMSMEDVRTHAQKYSQAYKSSYSPWTTNFEEMAKKTALKKALKYAPLRSDFVTADGTVSAVDSGRDEPIVLESEDVIIRDEKIVDAETGEVLNDA